MCLEEECLENTRGRTHKFKSSIEALNSVVAMSIVAMTPQMLPTTYAYAAEPTIIPTIAIILSPFVCGAISPYPMVVAVITAQYREVKYLW